MLGGEGQGLRVARVREEREREIEKVGKVLLCYIALTIDYVVPLCRLPVAVSHVLSVLFAALHLRHPTT